jgi:hypothetical protein
MTITPTSIFFKKSAILFPIQFVHYITAPGDEPSACRNHSTNMDSTSRLPHLSANDRLNAS